MLFFNLNSYVKGVFFRNNVIQGCKNVSITGGAQHDCTLERVERGRGVRLYLLMSKKSWRHRPPWPYLFYLPCYSKKIEYGLFLDW